MAPVACLVRGSLAEAPKRLAPTLRDAAGRVGPGGRVYVLIRDASDCATDALLEWLGQLYGLVGDFAPRLDLVPLLPFAGWDEEAVAALDGVEDLSMRSAAAAASKSPASHGVAGSELRASLGAAAPAAATTAEQAAGGSGCGGGQRAAATATLLKPLSGKQQAAAALAEAPAAAAQAGASAAAQGAAAPAAAATAAGAAGERHAFQHVAVGGTFDRLHAGHRLLLAATALTATELVYVGVTADELLAKKAHREWLQSLEERTAAAVGFMRAVRPGLCVEAGALRDPAEPTQAELDPKMQALVVSRETRGGGEAINRGRAARGFDELRLVVVNLVGESADGGKLSSTALREQDAAAGRRG